MLFYIVVYTLYIYINYTQRPSLDGAGGGGYSNTKPPFNTINTLLPTGNEERVVFGVFLSQDFDTVNINILHHNCTNMNIDGW